MAIVWATSLLVRVYQRKYEVRGVGLIFHFEAHA
jgi:hypothetical protein